MRRLVLLVAALFAGAACSGDRDRGPAARVVSDSGAGAPPAPVIASAAAVVPAAAPHAATAPVLPDSEVRAVCAAAAAGWRAVRGVTSVRELDTLLTARDVIEDTALDTVPPPGSLDGRWVACAVEGYAAAGLDSVDRGGRYWPAAGWVVFPRLNADGPGGQVQVYQRGWVRCEVAGEWDPGDDGDSTYVPVPFHREWTFCWRHGRQVSHADTVYLGG